MNLLLGNNGQLFGWSDQTWLFLDQLGILLSNLFMVLSVIGAVLGIRHREAIRQWLHRNSFPQVGETNLPQDIDAVIFTFSRGQLPRWVISQLRPRWVGLVPTLGFSDKEALPLAENLRANGIEVHTEVTEDPDDPQQTRRHVEELIRQARHAGCKRIVVDVTGGKVPMSLGAFMAAEEQGLPTFYVTAAYQGPNTIKPGSQRIIVISNPEETP